MNWRHWRLYAQGGFSKNDNTRTTAHTEVLIERTAGKTAKGKDQSRSMEHWTDLEGRSRMRPASGRYLLRAQGRHLTDGPRTPQRWTRCGVYFFRYDAVSQRPWSPLS